MKHICVSKFKEDEDGNTVMDFPKPCLSPTQLGDAYERITRSLNDRNSKNHNKIKE